MLTDRHFPYSSMQEINLDWILTKVKNILRFVPDDGAVGQILRRTAHGAEWSDEQGAGGSVTSVNGMQGAVVLTAADVGALPDTYAAPVDSVNGQTGTVVLSIPSDTADLTNTAGFVDAAGAAAAAPVQSVNGQTGAVSLSIPSDTSDLTNTAGFVNAAGAAAAAPVQSVNGQTGNVVVSAGGIDLVWTNPSPTSSFASQTVLIDLSSYNAVIVEFNYTDTSYGYTVIAVKNGLPMQANCITNILSASIGNVVYRTAQMTSTGVLISDCYRKAFNATTVGTVDNTRMIPIRIYGIM